MKIDYTYYVAHHDCYPCLDAVYDNLEDAIAKVVEERGFYGPVLKVELRQVEVISLLKNRADPDRRVINERPDWERVDAARKDGHTVAQVHPEE
jgi:hypothetical protein